MNTLKSLFRHAIICGLFLFFLPAASLSQSTATYTLDAVSGWLTITSEGVLDVATLSPRPTVIEAKKGVTLQNVPATYIGVGDGTLLSPQGATLKGNQLIEQKHLDCYVLMADVNGGTYTLDAVSGLGTLCFPNNVKLPGGVRAFKAIGVAADVLNLEEATDKYDRILMGTPVILYSEGGGEITLGHTGVVSQAPAFMEQKGNLLVGINNTMTVQPQADLKHYLMQNHEGAVGFYAAIDNQGDPRSFKATRYRCFLNLPASTSAKALQFTIPERSTSGLTTNQAALPSADGFYTLDGKPVSQPLHGEVYLMRLEGRTAKVIIR